MVETSALLDSYLHELRLPTMLRNYRQVAQDAATAQLPYDRFLLALLEQEISQRERNRQTNRIKAARLPVLKELSDFDFTCIQSPTSPQILSLAQGQYLPAAEPIILVGNPGLGKTHIAIALALAACRQGHKVRFYNVAALLNELIAAQAEQRLQRFIAAALKQQLIVLDELGFIPFSPLAAQLLFQFCSALYERVPLLITTNLRFADWSQVFGDERLSVALLDRLTHRAHILEFVGDSFRLRQTRKAASRARGALPTPVVELVKGQDHA
jgi:DNA replication protein DnaC